jgi:hypothetical protein
MKLENSDVGKVLVLYYSGVPNRLMTCTEVSIKDAWQRQRIIDNFRHGPRASFGSREVQARSSPAYKYSYQQPNPQD